MTKRWKPGESVALRGIFNQHVWYMQTALVIQDTLDEVALAVLPGAECAAPEGYINGKHGAVGHWDRWGSYLRNHWNMQTYSWRTNRLLILLETKKYYAEMFFWEQDSNTFICYYINFQLPFRRSPIGFDTLDLELDLIVEPNFAWRWKDVENYRQGIDCGIIRKEWTEQIERPGRKFSRTLRGVNTHSTVHGWIGSQTQPGSLLKCQEIGIRYKSSPH